MRAIRLIGVVVLAGCGSAARAPVAVTNAGEAKPAPSSPAVEAPAWLAATALDMRDTSQELCLPPDDGVEGICELEALAGVASRGAILDAKLLRYGDRLNGADCFVVIHTAAGWGTSASLGTCGSVRHDGGNVQIRGAWLNDRVLMLRTESSSYYRNYDEQGDFNLETQGTGIMLCSVGAGGEPSCTPHLVTSERTRQAAAERERPEVVLGDWSAAVDASTGAIVRVGGAVITTPLDPEWTEPPVLTAGTYQVSFP